LMSDVVFVGDLSGDQMGESTWWVGLLSWVFIYVERKHYFAGWWMSGPVTLREGRWYVDVASAFPLGRYYGIIFA